MKRCLVFNIANAKELYACSLGVMMKLEKKYPIVEEGIPYGHIFYEEIQEETARPLGDKEVIECLQSRLTRLQGKIGPEQMEQLVHIQWKELQIWFFVTDAMEEDIVNLQYFALIRQRYPQCKLYIQASDLAKYSQVYAKASQFLQYVVREEKQAAYFGRTIRGEKQVLCQLAGHPIGALRNFSPLIEITSDEKTLKQWQMTVEDLVNQIRNIPGLKVWKGNFPDICVQDILNNEIRKSKRNNMPDKAAQLGAVKKMQFFLASNYWSYQIFYLCMEYFCTLEGRKKIEITRKRQNMFYEKRFFEMVKDMSVLAFYIMCIYDYVLKPDEDLNQMGEYDFDHLLRQVLNARDMADGILQLVENVHHSELQKGYFCFRIHGDSKEEPKQYLSSTYGNYMKEERIKRGEKKTCYLEVHVGDFSFLSVPEQFANNLRQRIDCPSHDKLCEDAKKLSLKSFFDPTSEEMEFWDEYNKIGENVVHHYGLQVFESLVRSNEGCFYAVSTPELQVLKDAASYSNWEMGDEVGKWHIPGTQYSILMPFVHEVHSLNSVINADIDYTEYIDREYKVIESIAFDEESFQAYEEELNNNNSYAELKEKLIGLMEDDFKKKIKEETADLAEDVIPVLFYDARRISLSRIEMFCKVIMLYLSRRDKKLGFYMSIINCSKSYFLEIVRMFAVFYNKQGLNSLMREVQIYLSGENPCEEFLLSGENIGVAVSRAEKLSFSRGIHPQCLKILNEVLRKRRFPAASSDRLKIVPFDLLHYKEENRTLFELGVEQVLNSDILRYEFGCKLETTHIRIGSKIHISSFYEAELLFHNHYYISRFAYILAKRLSGADIDWKRPLVLVGYETYSEMLLYELKQYLEIRDTEKQIEYVIYEQKGNGRFRYLKSPEEYRGAQFIFIVAINSTLTTHNKLRSSLLNALKKNGAADASLEVKSNFALILVRSNDVSAQERDDMEKEYWWEINPHTHTIKTELIPEGDPDVEYLVSVSTEWLNPLRCPLCFPQKTMLAEKPLIETNKASIVPMQMIGINESVALDFFEQKKKNQVDDSINLERVKQLKNSLIYHHVIRKGNHFNMYLKTERYFDENKEQIVEWLKSIRLEPKSEKDRICYDILIAPLHFSNTGFLAEVNHHVFHNAALVLHFDVEKEFRDNVRTKYSNLLALYQNLYSAGKKAEINFHFVDDTVISGTAFLRARSLIQGLFPRRSDGMIRVNIFSSIILLVSRMSAATERNYIENRERMFCYAKLRISSMRNHEDACTLCKIGKNFEELREESSTNLLCEYFDLKIVKYRPIYVEEDTELEQGDSEKRERAYRRMICSHIAGVQLEKLGYRKNDPEVVSKLILELLAKEKEDAFEYLLSYIKIWSRPFLVFRKSTKEAIFDIMLKIIEILLTDIEYGELDKIEGGAFQMLKDVYDIVDHLKKNRKSPESGKKLMALLLTLMTRLSDLGSNYVIRKENIRKIYKFVDELALEKTQKEEFEEKYLALVKRICCLSSDENKSVYLEHLLLYGQEYWEWDDKTGLPELSAYLVKDHQQFVISLFLENTRVISKAVTNLERELSAKNKDVEQYLETDEGSVYLEELIRKGYHFDNLKKILSYHSMLLDKGADCKLTERGRACLKGAVFLYRMLKNGKMYQNETDKKDIEKYYDHFLALALAITGAKNIQIMFPDQLAGAKKYYVRETGTCICNGETLIGQCNLILDTYCVKKHDDGIWRSFIKYRNYVGERYSGSSTNEIGQIFMMLEFPSSVSGVAVYIGMKWMLLFHSQIVREFEHDFGNNLMQKWISEQYFKEQMLKARAGDHTDDDKLKDVLKMVSECPKTAMSEAEKKLFRELFALVINTYIARLNIRLLAGEEPYTENNEDVFKEIYEKQLKALLRGVKLLDEIEMCDKDGNLLSTDFDEEVMKSKIRMREEVRPQIKYLSIIITELVRSVPRHSNTKKVYTYREKGYFVIKNGYTKSDESIEEANVRITNSLNRRKDGISLAVTKEFFNKFYRLSEENGVKVMMEEETGGGRYFVVKLPIF